MFYFGESIIIVRTEIYLSIFVFIGNLFYLKQG